MDVEDGFNAEDLFGDDHGYDEENDENQDSNMIEEAIEVPEKSAKPKDEEQPKKRIIRNPQPKLNPDRICGPRGVGTLCNVFEDFKPKGGDHVFEDLDRAMKKMEHWAHRLYPKLPFDDCMSRISIVGKKMAVQTNVKKIRMGMEPVVKNISPEFVPEEADDEVDTTNRYDNDNEFPTEDAFEQIVRDAEEAQKEIEQESRPKTSLTDEQRERMMRNRQMAEQKRLARQLEKQKLRETQTTQDQQNDDDLDLLMSGLVENDNTTVKIITGQDEKKDSDTEKTESEEPLSQVFNAVQKSPKAHENADDSIDESQSSMIMHE